jgi:proteasome accessory factor B
MNLYRGQLARVLELDRRIRSGAHPNCTSFARDWEVSRKTIQRDIDFLRDRLGAPIVFDATRNGYVYTESRWSLPLLSLTEGELVQLLVAERMAAQYRGTPIAATLERLFSKIQQALPEPVTLNPAELETHFSFFGQPTRPISEAIWLPLLRGLRERRLVSTRYRKVGKGKPESRKLEPLHLACLMGEWYLVAWCRKRDSLRNFAVSGFESARVANESFEERPFDPDAWFAGRFGRYVAPRDKSHRVVIRFSREAAPWIQERRWHPEQEIKEHRDGRLSLIFPAPALYEVKRWVLQWGADAVVEQPERLRVAVAAEARQLAQGYRGVRSSGAKARHAWP